MENPGIDPGTSRMQSGRSTIWANSPVIGKSHHLGQINLELFLQREKETFALFLFKKRMGQFRTKWRWTLACCSELFQWGIVLKLDVQPDSS